MRLSSRDHKQQPIAFCLMGPTATGKTALALELLKRFPVEIISVDSTMVYRGMDIGSAKPTPEELSVAPHRLISFRDPSDIYSAADFRQDAIREIKDILAKNHIPLLVGGTLLYFKALQEGLSALPAADPEVRKKILCEANIHGWNTLHQKLTLIDPISAARIHPNDPQRLQRALEVYEITGETLTTLQQKQQKEVLPYRFINIGLMPENRLWLRERIAKRLDHMFQQNFMAEVKLLYQRKDLYPELPALRAVGYRQAWEYLDGKTDEVTMKKNIMTATCQLAKRQMTWLRHLKNIYLIDPQREDLLETVIRLCCINQDLHS